MKRAFHGMILATLLAGACSGCQSLTGSGVGTATVRGQSPIVGESPVYAEDLAKQQVEQTGHYHTPVRSTASAMQDHYHEKHASTTYFYGTDGQPAGQHGVNAAGFSGQPTAGYGNCPPQAGYGNCPPGNCPPGDACPGGCRRGCYHDRMSYGYKVPNDLVYPAPNAVGGAITYPYYTHRGPSDFFRK